MYRWIDRQTDRQTDRQICHLFFVRSFVSGLLVCFHVLTVVDSAAVNIEARVPFWITVLSEHHQGVGLPGHVGLYFQFP